MVFGGAMLVCGPPAFGATPPAGGAIQIYVTPPAGNSATSPIVITGAIGDAGKAVSMDQNGKVDASGNFVKITLKKGTFLVDATELNAATKNLQPATNTTTCSVSGTGSGPITISKGTGLYQGISGTATMAVTFAAVGPLYTSGAKKGQCNMSNNAKPVGQYSSITGTGTVSFS